MRLEFAPGNRVKGKTATGKSIAPGIFFDKAGRDRFEKTDNTMDLTACAVTAKEEM